MTNFIAVQKLKLTIAAVSVFAIMIYPAVVPMQAIAEAEPTQSEQINEKTINDTEENIPTQPKSSDQEAITGQPELPPNQEQTITQTPENSDLTVQEQTDSPTDAPLLEAVDEKSSALKIQIDNDVDQQNQSGNITTQDNDDINNASTGDSSGKVEITSIANNIVTTDVESDVTIQLHQPTKNADINISLGSNGAELHDAKSALVAKANIIEDTTINNNITVNSASGDITMIDNDDIGDVATGKAMADIEILNIATSIVASGDVTVGIINIDGDYLGDIVLSPDVLAQLKYGGVSNPQTLPEDTMLTTTSSISVNNNVDANAESGQINLEENDDIGDAQTGDALTVIDITNILGSYILYDNKLLVVINVDGEWGGNVLGVNDSNSFMIGTSPDSRDLEVKPVSSVTRNIEVNTTINNNVMANAKSGDIKLTGNDDIGSVTTGDASVRVKIANIVNNVISFGDWLGVLVINVFGNWGGSVVAQEEQQPTNGPPLNSPPSTVNNSDSNMQISFITSSAPFSPPNNFASGFGLGIFSPTIAEAAPSQEASQASTANQKEDQTFIAGTTTTEAPPSGGSLSWLVLLTIISSGMYAGYRLFQTRIESSANLPV